MAMYNPGPGAGGGGGFIGRPDKEAMMKDPQLAAGMYGPGAAAAAQTNMYGSGIPTLSGLSGMQGLSGLHPTGNRGMANTPQLASRSNTAPGYVGTNMGSIQLGAPSPPTATGRTGMLPMSSGRTSLMSTGQGLVAPKPRPSTLSSAIGSGLPVNSYGGIGRAAQGIMSPISSGYTSAFSETSNQAGFDPADFPLLGVSRNRHDASHGAMMPSSAALGRHGFTGPGQIPVSRSESVPGFQMHSEDFPALPGTSSKGSNEKTVSGSAPERDSPEVSQENKFPVSTVSGTLPDYRPSLSYDPAPGSNKESLLFTSRHSESSSQSDHWSAVAAPIGPPKTSNRKNYQPTTVSIPSGMVQDQFGMIGLLTFIRGAETDPGLVALALGSDLTTLGLNLNSPDNLYNTFASPWADSPCRPQDIDWSVPQEYLISPFIREKLAPISLNRYQDDLLFYLYYSNGGDIMQVLASYELYNRGWRYHKEERLWITRAPGMKPTKQEEDRYEEGTYCYFDVHAWRKAHKEFRVEYAKLEGLPQVPQSVPQGIHHGNQTTPTVA